MGKSTLLNSILGQKIAIVSDKPQTTRNRIQGIHTTERGQIIFIDTPGLHKPKHRLGEYMVNATNSTLREVDLILYVVDATCPPGPAEEAIVRMLEGLGVPVFLVINKIDLVGETILTDHRQRYACKMNYVNQIEISAENGTHVNELIERLFDALPEGPIYYPEDDITDQPERFLVGEYIREKALRLTHDEVPHSIAVEIEAFEERPNGKVYIRAAIYTERETQKGIMIGKNGAMLKKIGALARHDMEELLGCSVYLELWVKVRKDWRNNEAQLRNLGYTP